MKLKVWLLVACVLGLASAAVEDDFEEDEITVEDEVEAADEVTVEKVAVDVKYFSPDDNVDFYFMDHFDSTSTLGSKWTRSQAKKDGADDSIAKYDGQWEVEPLAKDPMDGDMGLVLKSKAKHSAVAAKLKKPFKFDDRVLVVQYEIAFQNGQDCGGGYLKLLSESAGLDLRSITDKTPYTIMFGPDRCGSDSKLHLIFRHVNPKNRCSRTLLPI